jgi:ankyrin repeat protein
MLIDAKADPNAVSSLRKISPIMLAANSGHLAVVNALIEARADVNFISVEHGPVLSFACSKPHYHPIVSALIAAGADPNHHNNELRAPLFESIKTLAHETSKILIDAGAEVNPRGKSLLFMATSLGNLEAAKLLVEANADVNAMYVAKPVERSDPPPLQCAVWHGSPKMAKYLLSVGAYVSKRSMQGTTAMHMAAQDTYSIARDQVRKTFSPQGAAKFLKNFGTPAEYNQVLDILIEARADVTIASLSTKQTPLSYAVEHNNHYAVKAISAEIVKSVKDYNSILGPALFSAASVGNDGIVTALLSAKADPSYIYTPPGAGVKDSSSALLMAVMRKHHSAARALVEAKAEVNLTRHEFSVLDYAMQNSTPGVVKLIRSAGGVSWVHTMVDEADIISAAAAGDLEAVDEILFDDEPVERYHAEVALILAAENGHRDVVQSFLETELNPSCCHAVYTPLIAAAGSGHLDIVKDLMAAKADPNASVVGRTAVQAASEKKHDDVVALLLGIPTGGAKKGKKGKKGGK